jgi:hypothetical protein
MTLGFLIGAIALGLIVLGAIASFGKNHPYALNRHYFDNRWTALLERVKTPEGMALAVIDADKLLDEALRRRHFRGKTTGERLVSAQRLLADNDAVWYAHKLRNRLVHEPNMRIKKSEAQSALNGFKKGLHDLGAL